MADVEKVFFKVEGMVKRGGFTWIGWPDAIVSALEGTEGIRKIVYLQDEELFELCYISSVISLKKIFAKITALGEERNLPYKSFVISMEQGDKHPEKP